MLLLLVEPWMRENKRREGSTAMPDLSLKKKIMKKKTRRDLIVAHNMVQEKKVY